MPTRTDKSKRFRAGEYNAYNFSLKSAALAPFDAALPIPDLVEGYAGISARTLQPLDEAEATQRLSSGFTGLGSLTAAGLMPSSPHGIINPYNPLSQPSYYNPLIYGQHVTPRGLLFRRKPLDRT